MGIGDIVVGGGEGNGDKKKEDNKIEKNTENKGKNGVGNIYTCGVDSEEGMKPRRLLKARECREFFENLTWLTSNEATDYLRLPSVGALRVLVCKRRVPFHKLGRSLRFKRAELDRLLETSKYGGL